MHLFCLPECRETVSTKKMKYFSWLSINEGRKSRADSSYLNLSTRPFVAYKSFSGLLGQDFASVDEPVSLAFLPRFPFLLFHLPVLSAALHNTPKSSSFSGFFGCLQQQSAAGLWGSSVLTSNIGDCVIGVSTNPTFSTVETWTWQTDTQPKEPLSESLPVSVMESRKSLNCPHIIWNCCCNFFPLEQPAPTLTLCFIHGQQEAVLW